MPVRTLHTVGEAGDEGGMALITALLIMLLCTIVVAAVLQLATHTTQQSGLSRDRQGALSAAQAGIQADLSLLSDGSCPTTGSVTATTLPDQNIPTESYVINAPSSCTPDGPAVISATGYVPNTTDPTAITTIVAHINRSDGAPVSGGASGGYDFPDAIFTNGALSTTALNLYGTGGAIPDITANGAIGFSGSQTAGSVTGQSTVNISSAQIGGNVAAGGSLTLSNTTVTGTVTYAGSYNPTGVTVNGSVSSGYIAPLSRPLPAFTNNVSDIGTTLGVGSSATSACPSATGWTQSYYNILSSCPSGYAPTAYSTTAGNGDSVIVVQGAFNVTIPPTATGGQLYIVDAGGTGDSLTITGSGSTLPVFAFTDGSMSLNGNLVGQFAGHSVTATGTLTFSPPATPMPDLAFPVGYTAPTALTASGTNAYVSTVTLQYQCPGTTAC